MKKNLPILLLLVITVSSAVYFILNNDFKLTGAASGQDVTAEPFNCPNNEFGFAPTINITPRAFETRESKENLDLLIKDLLNEYNCVITYLQSERPRTYQLQYKSDFELSDRFSQVDLMETLFYSPSNLKKDSRSEEDLIIVKLADFPKGLSLKAVNFRTFTEDTTKNNDNDIYKSPEDNSDSSYDPDVTNHFNDYCYSTDSSILGAGQCLVPSNNNPVNIPGICVDIQTDSPWYGMTIECSALNTSASNSNP